MRFTSTFNMAFTVRAGRRPRTWRTERSAETFNGFNVPLTIGSTDTPGLFMDAPLEFVGIKLGTFSDADLTAILTAA
jgi:hypothetical protein